MTERSVTVEQGRDLDAAGTPHADVGIGLVGAGWMGHLHATAYGRVARHYPECRARPRFVIVADIVEARAREAAEQLGFDEWTTEPLDVVNHPAVEALSITATNDAHMPVARAAAQRGKHFWGEKPLGRFPEETAEIASAANRGGIRTLVGFNYRHAPVVQHASKLIEDGQLGEIVSYRGRFLVDYASHPHRALSWRFLRDVAGMGALGDLMSHTVDMALHLAGPIVDVAAHACIQIPRRPRPRSGDAGQFSIVSDGEFAAVENEDAVVSIVRFSSGAMGTLEVSRTAVGHHCSMAFEVYGTRGALAWEFQRMNELQLYLPGLSSGDIGFTTVFAGPRHGSFGRFQPDTAVSMGYDDLKVAEAYLFLNSIVDGVQRAPGVEEARAVAEVLAAMRRAVDSDSTEPVTAVAAPVQ